MEQSISRLAGAYVKTLDDTKVGLLYISLLVV